MQSVASLSTAIKQESRRLGFDLVGIAPAVSPGGLHDFQEWLRRGYAGHMDYLERREPAYDHPDHVMDGAKSVVMLGLNYQAEHAKQLRNQDAGHHRPSERGRQGPVAVDLGSTGQEPVEVPGRVSCYAFGERDYHDVVRSKLRALADFVRRHEPDCRTRGVVDTAPLLERDFARLAGMGWFGKNTMLINKWDGSWFFLAALLVDIPLEADRPHETSHCGTCTRCLDACPTDAFPEPFVLDARRCISYLTIELRDRPIPQELRQGMGDWLFGCDVCQSVCPWNRKAPRTTEAVFQPVPELSPADAAGLLALDDEQFRARFAKTPLLRPGRPGLLRNAAIVLGNSGDRRAVPVLADALSDGEPLIRGAAAWALGQLGGGNSRRALQLRFDVENNAQVRDEIGRALESCARPEID